MQSTFFRGTSHDQDARFANKNKQLLTKLKFPSTFRVKVDMKKVALETIKPWVSQRITELLGIEDDVVVNLCFNMLAGDSSQDIDPRELQINLTGFMGQNAKTFVSELWSLLISAQKSDGGIPAELLERYAADLAAQQAQSPTPAEPIVEPKQREPLPSRRSPSPRRKRSYSPQRNRRRRSRSPGRRRSRSPRRRKRSPPRERRRSRRSRSKSRSVERRRHHDERRRRRRHRHRRSASQSSSSASRERSASRTKHQETAEKPVDKTMDPRAAEDELRMLALRSIVVNKNKQKDDKSDASPIQS